MNNENNHPDTAVNSEHLAEPVIIKAKPPIAMIIVLNTIMLPLGLVFLYGAFLVENPMGPRVVAGIFGECFLLLWAWVFIKYLRTRSAFVVIGPMGINSHINDGKWIRWDEIGAAGISVLHRKKARAWNAGQALARAMLPAARANIVVRLRIAGAVPGLPSRPDLRKWLTQDEPAPYTHTVILPLSPDETLERLRSVELAHEALSRYAGPLYTGVEYRKTTKKQLS